MAWRDHIGLHRRIDDLGELAAAEEASALRPDLGTQARDQLLLCREQPVLEQRAEPGARTSGAGAGAGTASTGAARRAESTAMRASSAALALRAFEAAYHGSANILRFATGVAGPASISASWRNSRTTGLRGAATGSGWPALAAAPADLGS